MNTNKKFYQKNWFIYLCMFFFPLIGVILMWLFNKKSSVKFKGIVSAVAAVWFILLLNSTPSVPAENEQIVSNEVSSKTENTISIETSEIAESTSIESEPISEPTETLSEPVNDAPETDLDIITREGHPTYYGSVALSHIIWEDVPKYKIIFGDSFDNDKDETILTMSTDRNSDLIRGINIYFSNFENPINLTVEDVLPIVSSYLPYDVINEYYQYKDSSLLVPDDDNQNERTKYYVISYSLTEEGKAAYYDHIHEYSGSIDAVITVDENDIVSGFSIRFGTPRWMYNLELNSYHKETWECNLLDNTSEISENIEDIQTELEAIPESNSEIHTDDSTDNVAQSSEQSADILDNTEASSAASNNFNTYDNADQQYTTDQYVLNTSTKKIHIPSCGSVPTISPKNYETSNQSIEELELYGYDRCGRCLK